MKNKIVALFLALAAVALIRPPAASAQTSVSISFFYDELSPYGRWATVGRYGDCWIPEHVASGWQPYTDGEWIYTDYGWTWVSYDPWGGDPYHYGTWVWEPPYGWVWVPGTVWGPSWVTWCYSDSYIGWAPIPPSLQISFSGYVGPAVVVSRSAYVFVPVNRFAGVRVSTARLPVAQNATFLQRTRRVTSFGVTNGIVVNRGPSIQRIEASAHVRIPRASIDAAKSRPMPLTAGGTMAHGKRLTVVAPAAVRARELNAHAPNRAASNVREAVPEHGKPAHTRDATETPHSGHGKASVAPGHEASPRHGSPPPHQETLSKHEGPPPSHDQAMPKHESAPLKHEAPPPHHEARPKHEAPPPHHEPPPPHHEDSPRHEATPAPRHEAPPPAHQGGRHQPPPKHEPPPPPPSRSALTGADPGIA